jgi:RNA polymerase sigma-70 factor (ECF subfamily)
VPNAESAPVKTGATLTPIRRDLVPGELSDGALLAAVRGGDATAAAQFYERLYPVVDHALRRVLRRRIPEFDDLVQVTFERVVRAIIEDRFAGHSALTTWAAAIAGHVAIDFLRRSVRERRVLEEFETPLSRGAPERRMEARSEIQRLHAVLSRMKPELAEAVLLFDVLGHSLDEVARLSGISQSAAQSRLHRGRKELVRRAGANRPRSAP